MFVHVSECVHVCTCPWPHVEVLLWLSALILCHWQVSMWIPESCQVSATASAMLEQSATSSMEGPWLFSPSALVMASGWPSLGTPWTSTTTTSGLTVTPGALLSPWMLCSQRTGWPSMETTELGSSERSRLRGFPVFRRRFQARWVCVCCPPEFIPAVWSQCAGDGKRDKMLLIRFFQTGVTSVRRLSSSQKWSDGHCNHSATWPVYAATRALPESTLLPSTYRSYTHTCATCTLSTALHFWEQVKRNNSQYIGLIADSLTDCWLFPPV